MRFLKISISFKVILQKIFSFIKPLLSFWKAKQNPWNSTTLSSRAHSPHPFQAQIFGKCTRHCHKAWHITAFDTGMAANVFLQCNAPLWGWHFHHSSSSTAQHCWLTGQPGNHQWVHNSQIPGFSRGAVGAFACRDVTAPIHTNVQPWLGPTAPFHNNWVHHKKWIQN